VAKAAVPDILAAGNERTITRENEIMMLAALGEAKTAIEIANSVLDRQVLDPSFLFVPVTRNLRLGHGFVPLASRLGLIKYWRETGKWPDFCTGPAAQSECSAELLAAIRPTKVSGRPSR
jgi:hypothetical protein